MRRKDREMSKEQRRQLLQAATVCRLAFYDQQSGQPHIVPLNYGWEEGRLLFHAAKAGRKLDLIRQDETVCFEIDLHSDVIGAEKSCDWTVKFASLIGSGPMRIFENETEKHQALEILMRHHGFVGQPTFPPAALRGTAVFELRIEQISGKCNDLAWFEKEIDRRQQG